jgi:hypothetical protein
LPRSQDKSGISDAADEAGAATKSEKAAKVIAMNLFSIFHRIHYQP